MEALAPVAVMVLFVALFALAIWLVVRQRRKIRAAFEGFAGAHGLRATLGAFPHADGELGGRQVYVGNQLGRRVNDVVRFVVRLSVKGAVPAAFIAMPRKLLTGAGTVTTGDADFDAKVRVDGDDAAAILAYLTPARRRAVLDLAAMDGWVVGAKAAVLKGTAEVCWESRGMTPDAKWLEARYAALERFAPLLDA